MSRLLFIFLLLWLAGPVGAEPDRRQLIDRHALAAPEAAEASVEKLAAYLCQGARSEEEKARAIFRWITDRVAYDVDGFLAGKYPDPEPENVLRTRSAVCEGYARLFVSLAESAGLEAQLVAGASKGYGFSNQDEMAKKQADHAWNVVKLDGQWRLVDSTWGAGAVNPEKKFVKRFNEHWFETRPEQFIYDHFPEDPRWQLLSRPLSREQFLNLVRVTSYYFRYGLQARSHPNALIRGSGVVEVKVQSPANVYLMADLLKDGKSPKRPLTFVQRQGSEQLIRVMLPARGRYQLRIYARDGQERESYDWSMDYQIESLGGRSPCPGYPKAFGTYQARGAVLLSPLEGRLKGGADQDFRLRIHGAEEVMVGNDQAQTKLTRAGSTFAGKVRLSPGPVRVYARFPGQTNFSGLLEYTVR